MLTLSKIKSDSLKYAKILGVIFLILVGIFLILKSIFLVKDALFPSPPPLPTVKFGVLPKVNFPQGLANQGFTYNLDTLSGSLPTFDDRINVHQMQGYSANLLDLENIEKDVATVGFFSSPTALSDKVYKWDDQDRSLTVNTLTNDFTMSSGFVSSQSATKIGILNESDAISSANEFLSSTSFMPSDIDSSKTTTDLYSVQDGTLLPVESLSNTNVVAVNYFQNDVDKLPIYYPSGTKSTMRILLGRIGSGDISVVDGYFYHQYVASGSATYPIISADDAFKKLKDGNGYIASYTGTDKNILIKDVSLGYFIGEDKQPYLVPIIVFKGNDNFVAYVPAVTDEWTSK